jgi:hypothetical protein
VNVVLLVVLTVFCAWGDSRGFIYASQVWTDGRPDWELVFRSTCGFTIGIGAYLAALKYVQGFGELSASVQTLAWFLVTIVGVAVGSRDVLAWAPLDQALAVLCVALLALVIVRTGT